MSKQLQPKTKQQHQHPAQDLMKIEPHDRDSFKGLFTFYRELGEQEYEIQRHRQEGALLRSADRQEKHQKSRERKAEEKLGGKKVKKSKNRLNVFDRLTTKGANQNKGEADKIEINVTKADIKVNSTQANIQEYSRCSLDNQASQTQRSLENPAQQFLQQIKQRKAMKSPQLGQLVVSQSYSPTKNRYKDDDIQKSQEGEKEAKKLRQSQSSKLLFAGQNRDTTAGGLFLKRNNTEGKSLFVYRKRLHTEASYCNEEQNLVLGHKVRNNFYSHPKLSKINASLDHVPQRKLSTYQLQNSEVLLSRDVLNLKKQHMTQEKQLPLLKRNKMNKQLTKIMQYAYHQASKVYVYDSTKPRKPSPKPKTLPAESPPHSSSKYLQQREHKLKQKIKNCYDSMVSSKCCFALVNLGSTGESEHSDEVSSWLSRKRLLMKKLGLKI